MLRHASQPVIENPTKSRIDRVRSTLASEKGTSLVWAAADQFLVGGTNVATMFILGRICGAENLGVFYLCLTLSYLIISVQESLITTPLTVNLAGRESVKRRFYAGAGLCQSLLLSLTLSALMGICALVCQYFPSQQELYAVLSAGAIVLPFWLLREFLRRYLFAMMRVHEVFAVSLILAAVQLTGLLVLAQYDALSTSNALLMCGLASGCASLQWLVRNFSELAFSQRSMNRFTRKNLLFGRWLLVSQSASVMATYAMPWLVVAWIGTSATGIFAACDAILRFANPLLIVLTNVLTPWVTIGHNDGGGTELRRIIFRVSMTITLFLSCFCVFLFIAGQSLLNASLGQEYGDYWLTLLILGINQLVLKQSLAPGRGLMVLDKARLISAADVSGFVTSLIAGWLLIPTYGVLGAAFAMLLGSAVISLLTISSYFMVMKQRYPQVGLAEEGGQS